MLTYRYSNYDLSTVEDFPVLERVVKSFEACNTNSFAYQRIEVVFNFVRPDVKWKKLF